VDHNIEYQLAAIYVRYHRTFTYTQNVNTDGERICDVDELRELKNICIYLRMIQNKFPHLSVRTLAIIRTNGKNSNHSCIRE
jgi:hypothetical protein